MKDQGNNQNTNKNQQGEGNKQPQGSQEQLRRQQEGSQNQPKGQNISRTDTSERQTDSKSADLDKPDSNTANRKGAVNTGKSGTQPTASQQQGQGAQNAKDHNNRSGSDSGQNTNKKTR